MRFSVILREIERDREGGVDAARDRVLAGGEDEVAIARQLARLAEKRVVEAQRRLVTCVAGDRMELGPAVRDRGQLGR
jgi:hypothetical protein